MPVDFAVKRKQSDENGRICVTLPVLCEHLRVSHFEHFSLTAVSAFSAVCGEKRPKSSPTVVEYIVSGV